MSTHQANPVKPAASGSISNVAAAEESAPLGITQSAGLQRAAVVAERVEVADTPRGLLEHATFGLSVADSIATIGSAIGDHFRIAKLARGARRLGDHVSAARKAVPVLVPLFPSLVKGAK